MTKKDFNPLIHSRLVHIDFDENLNNFQAKQAHAEAKHKLLFEFKKTFNLDGPIRENTIESADGKDVWFYSVANAKGTTMIMIAKWPVGLDCIHNDDVPNNYHLVVKTSLFNKSEKEYFAKHSDPIQFLELMTAKQSFLKCYFNEFNCSPDFDKWELIQKYGNIAYTNGKDTYLCNKGIGGNKYTFTVCEKE